MHTIGAPRLVLRSTILAFSLNLLVHAGAAAATCESLVGFKGTVPGTTVSSATLVARGSKVVPIGAARSNAPNLDSIDVPFCRVVLVIPRAINVEVWLPPPDAWNGKLQGVGNGGMNGLIGYAGLSAGVKRGYATVSSDLGHSSGSFDARWAAGDPAAVVDWGHRATHEMTVAAKALVNAFYDKAPRLSYFTGCSGGGRQGLMEAQRYPDDYDGIVAGAPTSAFTRLVAGGRLWVTLATLREPDAYIPPAKVPLIARAVIEACDANDGVRDGVLNDPRSCEFEPDTLLCVGEDAPTCLTRPQAQALKTIYRGSSNSRGEPIFPGYLPGGEDGPRGWAATITGKAPFESTQFVYANSFFKYMVFNDPQWNFRTFDYDRDVSTTDGKLAAIINATNPDLSAFRARRGKLIQYHGWSDPGVSPLSSITYYEQVAAATGSLKRTQEFYRLFMVPGMQHCGNGPGPNEFDALSALERWVEGGIAPDWVLASHKTLGVVDRTRPLCPYPAVARWSGSGSTDEAANFICGESSQMRREKSSR